MGPGPADRRVGVARQEVLQVTPDLPAQLQKLYNALFGQGDVPFQHLFDLLGLMEGRNPQQALGPYIVRLNRRLKAHKMRVVPGRLKKTYRLVVM